MLIFRSQHFLINKIMGTLFLLLVLLSNSIDATPMTNAFSYNNARSDEICGPHNGRKLYLELGERGVLKANNVSARSQIPGTLISSHTQCSFEIVTCPSCIITLSFRHLNLSSCSQDRSCRCDYVWVTEPPFESSGTPYCGVSPENTASAPKYRSQTRIVNIAFLFSKNHDDAFTVEYHAERNRQILELDQNLSKNIPEFNTSGTRGGVLSSPFFPASYPRDLGAEYVITSMDQHARVQILFSDFQLATSSIMEFYDWNGQRIEVTSGTSFRPAAIVSIGPSLLIRFYANGGAGLGYRATYTFITDSKNSPTLRPITDCGGFVENPGGAITMMHMVEDGVKHFDCIWIVKPPRNYFHLKTHIYLKIAQFSDFGGNTDLVVRQGTTSQGISLETLRSPVSEVLGTTRGQKELVIPVDVGFYISLRGSFGPRSKLAIVYAAFSYMDCFAGADFLCKNHRCISSRLSCDGFDHCGDSSDEPAATCFQDWSESSAMDRKWYTNTPNYFFPKMERYPDLKTATLVFLVSSLGGLILLIVALIVLLYRMGARARQQRELQNRLQTISELLDGARIDEIVPDEPPTYEAPPDYEEVIKVGSSQPPAGNSGTPAGPCAGPSVVGAVGVCSGGIGKRKNKNKGMKRERRRAKSSPGVCLNVANGREVALRVALPLSPPPHASHRTSWPDTQGGSAPMLLLASARTQSGTPVPDSPPPPYATDPSLAGSFTLDQLLPEANTNGSIPSVDQPMNYLQPMSNETTGAFEDSFTGVLTSNHDISIPDVSTLTSNQRPDNSVIQELNKISPKNILNNNESSSSTIESIPEENSQFQNICKLASVEHFDDINLSYDSIQSNNSITFTNTASSSRGVTQVDVPENFAHFDQIGQYPSCGSSKDTSLTQSLNRCESSPNCSSVHLDSNVHQISNSHPAYTQQELLTRTEPRSQSHEMLYSTPSANNFTEVNKQNSEPQFTENSKLLQSCQQDSPTEKLNLNFDFQIQLLKAQILEQNTKLVEIKKEQTTSNKSSTSTADGEVERICQFSDATANKNSDSFLIETILINDRSDSTSETSSENTINNSVFF